MATCLYEFMRMFQIGMYDMAREACVAAGIKAKRNAALWQYRDIAKELRDVKAPTKAQVIVLARIDELVEFTNGMH